MDATPITVTADEADIRTPEEAALEYAKGLLAASLPNRAERRAQHRQAQADVAKLKVKHSNGDNAFIKGKRAKLRRRTGNPGKRNDMLFAWIESVNDSRDGVVVSV